MAAGITVLTQHPVSDTIFSAGSQNALCWSKSAFVENRSKKLPISLNEGLD